MDHEHRRQTAGNSDVRLLLEALLLGTDRETFRATEEDRKWLDAAPTGRELL